MDEMKIRIFYPGLKGLKMAIVTYPTGRHLEMNEDLLKETSRFDLHQSTIFGVKNIASCLTLHEILKRMSKTCNEEI